MTKNQMTIADQLNGERFKSEIAKVLPKHMTPERMARVAMTALRRTPKLRECSPESFFKCLMDLSSWGLEPDGRRAHLIPYNRECTLILDYKGIVELAMRSGRISTIHSDVICENDDFVYDRGEVVRHRIEFGHPRGEVLGVYCLVKFKEGAEKAEVMTTDEVEVIRKRSKAGNSGPWKTDWNEMAKKTVFRRCSKWLPLTAEQADAMERDVDAPASMVRRATPTAIDVMASIGGDSDKPQDELEASKET
jgi:recombination protein RecT